MFQERIKGGLLILTLALSVNCANSASYTFDCDTPEGRYSQVEIPLDATNVEVSGQIEVNDIRLGTDWAPGASVVYHDGKPESAVGLRAFVLAAADDKIAFHVQGSEKSDLHAFGARDWKNAVVTFKVRISSSGHLEIHAGESAFEFQTSATSTSVLSLVCSSGDFTFRNVVVKSIRKT